MQLSSGTVTAISTGNQSSAVSELVRASQFGSKAVEVSPFADLFSNAVGQINQLEDKARIEVDRMMTGTGVDVHQAMIATQKASMAFELALAMRNKAVQAYQSLMSMQF